MRKEQGLQLTNVSRSEQKKACMVSRKKRQKKTTWTLHLKSKEEAATLYSFLLAFQMSDGGGILNREALKRITQWIDGIEKQVPGIKGLASDRRGPYRERDLTPLCAFLVLDEKERFLMLFVCQIAYGQLVTPEGRQRWIENQGQEDYQIAVKGYWRWIRSLERKRL